jgi:hypothetical protein
MELEVGWRVLLDYAAGTAAVCIPAENRRLCEALAERAAGGSTTAVLDAMAKMADAIEKRTSCSP